MHQKQFYVGVDWASQSHHVCVLKADGDRPRPSRMPASSGTDPDLAMV